MGLLRSGSQHGAKQERDGPTSKKGSAMAQRNTAAPDAQRQKSVSSQERPKTAHSQPERPKTADKHGQDRPKTADKAQAVDRRSFSRPRTGTSANSAGKSKDKELETGHSFAMALPPPTIDYMSGTETYRFPTPSPRLPPQRSATTHVPSSAKVSLPATSTDESPRIGVAIGSPSEPAPQWGRTHTVDHIATQASVRPEPARAKTELARVPDREIEQLPKKKGSWKNLGGIFGRKPSTKTAPSEPSYHLKPPQEHEEHSTPPTRTLHSASRQQAQLARTPTGNGNQVPVTPGARAQGMTRGMARMEARMQADRATFEDKENHDKQGTQKRAVRTPSIIQKESASPLFAQPNAPRSSEDIFKTTDTTGNRNDSPLSNFDGTGPLRLDLDIPDFHMERYSVMFENFLSSSAEQKPSIIERRQSKLQKKRSLKRLDQTKRKDTIEMPKVPQRSATSPHLTQMPGSLSIKTGKKVRSPMSSPTTAAEAEAPVTAVHRPQPVKRSNTTPLKTAECAVRQNFSKPRMVMVTEPTVVESPAPQLPHLSMYSENSLPPTPTSGVDSGEESPFRPPPLPTTTTTTIPPPKSKHAADHSGTWDMLTANPNTTAIPKRKGSLARQEPPANPYRRVKSPEDLDSRVVQVSVARQVSVSKARKQVRQAVDAKQPLRPRVVELGKNRKSTMVLIEGAEDGGAVS